MSPEYFKLAYKIAGDNYLAVCLITSGFVSVLLIITLELIFNFIMYRSLPEPQKKEYGRVSRKHRRRIQRQFIPYFHKIKIITLVVSLIIGGAIFIRTYYDYYFIKIGCKECIKIIVMNFDSPDLNQYFGHGLNAAVANIIQEDFPFLYADIIKIYQSDRFISNITEAKEYAIKCDAEIIIWGYAIAGSDKANIALNICPGKALEIPFKSKKVLNWAVISQGNVILDFSDPYRNLSAIKVAIRKDCAAYLSAYYLGKGDRISAINVLSPIYFNSPATDTPDWCLKYLLAYWLEGFGRIDEAVHVLRDLEKEQIAINDKEINDIKWYVQSKLENLYRIADSVDVIITKPDSH